MRMLDWVTACFAVGVVVGLVVGGVCTWFGVTLVSGVAVTAEGEVANSPYVVAIGVFFLTAAVGCFLAAGYCTWVLWEKYHGWRQWLRFRPPRSYWDVAGEAEEKRDSRR